MPDAQITTHFDRQQMIDFLRDFATDLDQGWAYDYGFTTLTAADDDSLTCQITISAKLSKED